MSSGIDIDIVKVQVREDRKLTGEWTVSRRQEFYIDGIKITRSWPRKFTRAYPYENYHKFFANRNLDRKLIKLRKKGYFWTTHSKYMFKGHNKPQLPAQLRWKDLKWKYKDRAWN